MDTRREGLTLTVIRSPGAVFDLGFVFAPNYPAEFGSYALDPFWLEEVDDWFVGTFSEPVTSVALDATDFAQDQDELELYAVCRADRDGRLHRRHARVLERDRLEPGLHFRVGRRRLRGGADRVDPLPRRQPDGVSQLDVHRQHPGDARARAGCRRAGRGGAATLAVRPRAARGHIPDGCAHNS